MAFLLNNKTPVEMWGIYHEFPYIRTVTKSNPVIRDQTLSGGNC